MEMEIITIGTGGLGISHLFFTNDLLIFGHSMEDQAMCIKEVLGKFSFA